MTKNEKKIRIESNIYQINALFYAFCSIGGRNTNSKGVKTLGEARRALAEMKERQRAVLEERSQHAPSNSTYVDKNGTKKRMPRKMPTIAIMASLSVNRLVGNAIGKVLTMARSRDRARKWNRDFATRLADYSKDYYMKHRLRIMEAITDKRRNNPQYRICADIRHRIARCLAKGVVSHRESYDKKIGKIEDVIQCSSANLVAHIDAQILADDSGKALHTDHVFPLAMYDMTSDLGIKKSNHWSNLQPLPSSDNKSKNARLPTKAMAAKVDPACWPDGITEDMLPDIYPGWRTPLRM